MSGSGIVSLFKFMMNVSAALILTIPPQAGPGDAAATNFIATPFMQ
jgi:hypothetical protein